MTEKVTVQMSEPNVVGAPAPEPVVAPSADAPPQSTNMPADVPAKYVREDGSIDVESLVTRHNQLEELVGKQSAPAPDPAAPVPAAPAAGDATVMDSFISEWTTTGRLSDSAYGLLQEKGFDRTTVDTIMAGKVATRNNYNRDIADAIGGLATANEYIAWGNSNLTDAEMQTINADIHSGDPGRGTLALRRLKDLADKAAAGPGGQFVLGRHTPDAGGTDAFKSREEFLAATNVPDPNDPKKRRYDTDPLYHREVNLKRVAMQVNQQAARMQR
jgi:hypothetical protein